MGRPILELMQKHLRGEPAPSAPMMFPPPIARTIGFDVVEVEEGRAVVKLVASPERHANPMGTVHGGVLCDIADAAIGTAHGCTLAEGETFTSVDLKINFFRPVWSGTLTASAQAVQRGKTVSYYECRITDDKDRLIAIVTSTVMTLRGEAATGR
jgi:uncharacterized protein (TIGR00369 family)